MNKIMYAILTGLLLLILFIVSDFHNMPKHLLLPQENTKIKLSYNADADTMFCIDIKTQKILYEQIYFHIGGYPGSKPDSVLIKNLN